MSLDPQVNKGRGATPLFVYALLIFAVGMFLGSNFVSGSWHEGAFRDLQNWAARLIRPGNTGGGWTCLHASHGDILEAAHRAAPAGAPTVAPDRARNMIFEYPHARTCFKEAKIKSLIYDASLDMVAGVWRCAHGDLIGEFQLELYRTPTLQHKTDHFCTYAMFRKDLHIPVGAVTRFSTP